MRLPVAVPPARHETAASYLARLASLHGLDPCELWQQVSSPQPGTRRREVVLDRLAAITGRPAGHLAQALSELHPACPAARLYAELLQPRRESLRAMPGGRLRAVSRMAQAADLHVPPA